MLHGKMNMWVTIILNGCVLVVVMQVLLHLWKMKLINLIHPAMSDDDRNYATLSLVSTLLFSLQ